ncbi:MAG: sigma 54-interacting transcriptional regulator, partial [Bacillota bacterium]|nr:sigma 54-interacting transcriptional regulator [Bacillota bacterium]
GCNAFFRESVCVQQMDDPMGDVAAPCSQCRLIHQIRRKMMKKSESNDLIDLTHLGKRYNIIRVFPRALKSISLGVLEEISGETPETRTALTSFVSETTNPAERKRNHDGAEIIGMPTESEMLKSLLELARNIAPSDVKVLIQGETGVGKELMAKAIYHYSHRSDKPFVKVNCGAISPSLLESELFGYEGGAFTGAKKEGKEGYFELADEGTLFLDEISELPLDLQVKLLRVLQENEIIRVGGGRSVKVDVRIIAATNKNLLEEVTEGRFRMDLFYRLNVVPITIPPLRDRPEDIAHLAPIFLHRFNRLYHKALRLSPKALTAMKEYSWPGNVRELEHFIERCVLVIQDSEINEVHVQDYENEMMIVLENEEEAILNDRSLKDAMDQYEKNLLLKAVRHNRHNTRAIAEALQIDPTTVFRKCRKHGIHLR